MAPDKEDCMAKGLNETMAPDKEDCICPICLCIFIEPVTMPCKHSLCMPCYKQTVEKANLCCPICRLRISVWTRRASKMNCLVDKVKWEMIKKTFPEQVQNRLEGNESQDDVLDDSDNFDAQQRRLKELSKPGEIRQEYEAALQKLQCELEKEAKVEEEASVALIKALQQEEEEEMEMLGIQRVELDKMDREIAEVLQNFEPDADYTKIVVPDTSFKSFSPPSVSSKVQNITATGRIMKGKKKQLKQPASNTLTLTTFFSPVHRGGDPLSPSSDFQCQKELSSADSCSFDSHQSFHTHIPDNFSQKFSSHPSTSRERNYFVDVHCWNTHSEKSNLSQKPLQTTVSSELEKNVEEFDVVEQPTLKRNNKDQFTDCQSGLATFSRARDTPATSCAERVDTHSTSASSSGKSAHLPDEASHTKPKHAMSHYQPFIKCTRISPEQLSTNFVVDSQPVMTEAENSVAGSKHHLCTSSHDCTPFQTPNPDTGCKTLFYPIKDQCLQKSDLQKINNVYNNSSQNGLIVSNKTGIESNKDGIDIQDCDYGLCQTPPEALDLKPKLDPRIKTKEIFSDNYQKEYLSVISGNKQAARQTRKDEYSDEVIWGFSESGANERKGNDNTENEYQERSNTESRTLENNFYENGKMRSNRNAKLISNNFGKGMMETSNLEKRQTKRNTLKVERKESCNAVTGLINNSGEPSVISFDKHRDIYAACDHDGSGRTQDNDGHCVTTSSDRYVNTLSNSIPDNADKSGSISGDCLSGIDFKCNGEKENNSVKSGSNQRKDAKNSKKINIKSPVRMTVFKNRNNSRRTRNSKRVTASSVNRKNTSSYVSIERWCLNNSDKREGESDLRLGDKIAMDKTETRHVKNNIPDENENIVVERNHQKEAIMGKRGNLSDLRCDVSCSGTKKFRRNDRTEKSGVDTGDVDVMCLQDPDDSEMTQEQKDHLLAMQLQEMYAKLDKQRITVDRSKGSKDQYGLRKNRK